MIWIWQGKLICIKINSTSQWDFSNNFYSFLSTLGCQLLARKVQRKSTAELPLSGLILWLLRGDGQTIRYHAQCLLPSVAGGKRGEIFQGIVQSRKLTYGVTATGAKGQPARRQRRSKKSSQSYDSIRGGNFRLPAISHISVNIANGFVMISDHTIQKISDLLPN